ncbi:protein Bouncer-like [Sebastes fasciatus]|uniref:protein Bouncer-like n=1 Tax=Sebastes fasciatus TaxID=394691 RepID=UPI003D9E050A
MGTQRKNSLDVHLLRFLLATALVLPALSLDSLLCYFCPLNHLRRSYNITTNCLPGERCAISRGYYGSFQALSSQGCLDAELCDSYKITSYWGLKFNVSHTCCCTDKCNGQPKSDTSLKRLLGMIKGKIDRTNITNTLSEEPWDSCANYTSSTSTVSPATAS